MATEYIKREDALNAIRKSPISNMGTRIFCIDAIADIPAADVVPRELYQRALSDVVTLSVERKRGKWERKLVPVCDDGIIIIPGNVCSECGGITTYNVSLFKYCPRCGAQMESGDK